MKKINEINKKRLSFIATFICYLIVVFVFGSLLNTSTYYAKLFTASNYQKGKNGFSHLEIVLNEEEMTYEKTMTISRLFYDNPDKCAGYAKTKNSLVLNYIGEEYNLSIISVGAYSDKDYMEYLHLPLYLDDSSIGRGSSKGNNVSYIPATLAEKIAIDNDLSSFDELIEKNECLELLYDNTIQKFPIINIFYDKETTFWKNDSFSNDSFIKYFNSWNSNSIISYCPQLLKELGSLNCFIDIKNGFGNLDYVSKTMSSIDEQLSFDIKIHTDTENSNPLVIKALSSKNINNSINFFFVFFIIIEISLCVVFSIFSYYLYRHDEIKTLLIPFLFICSIFVSSEVLKGFFSTKVLVFQIFNMATNAFILIVFLVLLTLLLFSRRNYEKNITNNFYTISI